MLLNDHTTNHTMIISAAIAAVAEDFSDNETTRCPTEVCNLVVMVWLMLR